ncbi:LLM class flavin-dependent oxidoreductase [Sphingobium fuliginis ATCC 27551]|uniref:LLM class flavin-dependent oxidoreductase n=2 Tax=Sphingobium fuliginis (strain ATCC 27551) TaxID=336203 RepID=A0A5B8CJF3_SPHSA|nr:LLM class flavin-dependent oxidoreductase [Sphingobium fuliginis ATCC 27551]
MATSQRQMKIGISMRNYGYNGGAWRHPDIPVGSGMDYGYYRSIARTAERGMLDMLFLADSVSMPLGSQGRDPSTLRFEPLTLLSALSSDTRHIGLVATVSTTFQAPFHIARMFASLDHLSGGRAGWNVVTSHREDEQQNFGGDPILPKDQRYDRAEEAVSVVRKLWSSWDADALVRDKASGLYYDPAKVGRINHAGPYFSSAGPLNVPRPPQGHPLIIQAGASERGQDLAAQTADVVYAAATELACGKAFYHSLKSRMPRFGRHADDLKIMPGILPVVGSTMAEAEAKYRQMQDLIDPAMGVARLTNTFGDVSAFDLDAPFPAELERRGDNSSRIALMVNLAKERGFTLRQLYQHALIASNHHVVVGTPAMIVDVMEHWFAEDAADGFNIVPAFTPLTLGDFVDLVRPELLRRGLVRDRYRGATLRENMDLSPIQEFAE